LTASAASGLQAARTGDAELCVSVRDGAASARGPSRATIDERRLHCAVAGTPSWSSAGTRSSAIGDPAAALLDLYMARGDALLDSLAGAFAFCIVDLERGRTLAAADRMGIWRLHYVQDRGRLVVASSLDALLRESGSRPAIDLQALYDYVYFHMIPAPRTIYAGVRTLRRAELLRVERHGISTRRYWQPDWRADVPDAPPAWQETQELLSRAVERALAGDAAGAGCFLSGGLDSSSVAGMAARVRAPQPVSAFSVGFDEAAYDESDFARAAAETFRLDWHRYELTADETARMLPGVAAAFEQPFGNSSALAVHACARSARERGCRRMLAGDGGDEIFGGNSRYAKQLLFERLARWPEWLRKGVVAPLTGLAAKTPGVALARKLDSYVTQANVPLPDRLQSYNFLHRHAPQEVFARTVLEQVEPLEPLEMLRTEYFGAGDPHAVNRMLHLDWQFTLQDNDLVKVSTMCRHAGVGVAYPMLDDDLVAFSCRIAGEDKLRDDDLRRFYRHAMRGFLPDAVIDKKKHGFGLPFGVWTRTHHGLRRHATDAIESLRQRRLFEPAFLDRALALHSDVHAGYYGELVWILMVLELWFAARLPHARF
jgi:asparagine synthase (glutamine-hydrolysing)